MPPAAEGESQVFRPAGISYLRIPSQEPQQTAAFYESVFGWSVNKDRPDPSFEDGTGHVIGHFIADQPVAGEAGNPEPATSSASGSAGPATDMGHHSR